MDIHFYEELPSTNRTASEAARGGAEEFYTVVANRQSVGRGRMERSFFSPMGGTYFSTVLRPKMPIGHYGQITPMAAVAVHRALYRLTGTVTEIKWINDLLLNGKKVCGILAESGTDEKGKPFVILGIGINTAHVDFPPELCHTATFIPCADRVGLINAILTELAAYEQLIKDAAWLPYYREYCGFLGNAVLVCEGNQSRVGVALDILGDGALRVDFGDGRIEDLRGGEISLRFAHSAEI